jgi:hypothetical protein
VFSVWVSSLSYSYVAKRGGYFATSAYGLGTYNGHPSDQCTNPGEWSEASYPGGPTWTEDAQGVIVFGDSSCSYTADDVNHWQLKPHDLLGTLTCTKRKDAKC